MSKHREQPVFRIRPRSSRLLAIFLLVAHGMAMAVVLLLPLEWHWRVLLVALAAAGLVNALGTHVTFAFPWAGREVTWGSDGTWILTLVSGEQIQPRLLPATFVATKLVVLNFRCGRWRSLALVLTSDSLDPDLLRRLRVRLRLAGAQNRSSAAIPS